jgi:hypothetical protein
MSGILIFTGDLIAGPNSGTVYFDSKVGKVLSWA